MESNEMNHGKILGRRIGSNRKSMEKMIAIRNAAYERGGKYLCQLCGHTARTIGGFTSHLYRTHDMKVSEYKMAIALNKHSLAGILPKKPKIGPLVTKGRQDCKLCGWTGRNYSSFASHLRREHRLKVNQYREKVKPKT